MDRVGALAESPREIAPRLELQVTARVPESEAFQVPDLRVWRALIPPVQVFLFRMSQRLGEPPPVKVFFSYRG